MSVLMTPGVIGTDRLRFPWGAAFLKHPPLKLVHLFFFLFFLCAALKLLSNTPTQHARARARTLERSHCSRAVFQPASVLPLLSYEVQAA